MNLNFSGKARCHIDPEPVRLLGYAWVGAQTPYPEGPTNPFIIALNAWESDKPVEEIGRSYAKIDLCNGLCPSLPDLVKLATTAGWTDWDARKYRAADIMAMQVSADADRARVRFNASATSDHGHPAKFPPGRIRVPGETCDSDGLLSIEWPQSTVMKGSLTNETLEVRIDGADEGDTNYVNFMGSQERFNVTFSVGFKGTFDSLNSTRALQIQPGNATLAWVSNGGSQVMMVLSGRWGLLWAGLATTACFLFSL